MQKSALAGAVLALALPFFAATAAAAGPIERACNKSDSARANRAVCACIQQVADMTLKGADQRRAAKLLNDPDKAHDVWLSKRESDDAFWERYKAFGAAAQSYCAG